MKRAARPTKPVVAVLVKRFPRLSETFVLNEFLELRRQGVPVRLFALQDPGERHAQPEAEALRGEVVYLRPGRWWWLRVVPEALRWTARRPGGVARAVRFGIRRRSAATWRHAGEALIFASHLRRANAGHLHAHFAHSPAAVAYLTHLVAGIPFSFTAHAKDLYTTPAAYVAERGAAAAFVATCTAANAEHLREITGRDAVLTRHGVDLARFGGVVRQPVPGRILAIGRLVPKKGFDVLLRALAALAARDVPFDCRILGGGPLRDELCALAAALGIADRVAIEGARPQDRLLEEYAAAEVFALAPVVTADGDRDGIPNVLLEAMATGAPVVSSSISGIPELITDGGNGLLVPPGDPAALADALRGLLADPAARKRLAVGGLETAGERGLEACVRPLGELLRRRLDGATAARGAAR